MIRRGLAGAAAAALVLRVLKAAAPGGQARWRRTNHRGREVTLLSGPALALATAVTSNAGAAAAVAGLGAGVVGRYDDVAGARDAERGAKGVRGHLAALRGGQITAGAVKVAGVGVAALASAALLGGPVSAVVAGAGVVAGSANLLNLLDLRPGRALKVGGVAALLLGEPGPAGAVAALLPGDLRERTMLGDAGANALGAVLGASLLARLPSLRGRLAALTVLVGLTAASEMVSFTEVIAGTPVLDRIDRWGRR